MFNLTPYDIISENYGKEESGKTVLRGFLAIIVSFLLVRFAIWLPDPMSDSAYARILGASSRIMLASVSAYLVSQSLDVIIFHHIKDKTRGKHKWLRNNVGTICSQVIDTMIFTFVAFYGVVPDIWGMILDVIIAKTALAILDTPFFYFFTRKRA